MLLGQQELHTLGVTTGIELLNGMHIERCDGKRRVHRAYQVRKIARGGSHQIRIAFGRI